MSSKSWQKNNSLEPFFIIGTGRSGSSALVEALDTSPGATVHSEDKPKFCIAARMHYEGVLPYPSEFIVKSKIDSIRNARQHDKLYGDKNPNYIHFVEELNDELNPKFIFLVRDGRDVVRSCMDFHQKRGPGYERYEDDADSELLQPEETFWDFARLRPRKEEQLHNRWRELTQFEKFAWQWSRFNELILETIESLPENTYRLINMTDLVAEDVKPVFEFLGLEGFSRKKIKDILNSDINTTELDPDNQFPDWQQWDAERMETFNSFAETTMENLGFYSSSSS